MAASVTDLRRSRDARALVAAARKLDEVDNSELHRQIARHEKWKSIVLGVYDEVGEVHYAVTMSADALAKGRLYVAARPESNAELIPADDPASGVPLALANRANEKLLELRAPVGGQSQIVRMAAVLTQLVGEWFLIEYDGEDESKIGWHVRSDADIKVESDGSVTVADLGNFDTNDVSRVWKPHPAKFESADSGMRAVLSQCETVLLCDRQFRSGLRSRLFAGLLLLSNDFRSATGPPNESTASAGDGEATDDPIVMDILTALSTGIQDEGTASAVVPNVLYGSPEAVEKGAKLVTFAQQVDAQVMALRESSLRRIAQGLDEPPEIVLGMGDINHWGQWFIGESFVQHAEPKAAFLADAFTTVFLRPELESEGFDADDVARLEVAFDLSPLMRRPNADEDARTAYNVGELNGEGLRHYLGIPEDFAPDEEERLLWLLLNKAQFGQSLTVELLRRLLAPDLPDVTPDPMPGQPDSEPPADEGEPNSAPIAASAGSVLTEIDIALTERLFAAARAAFGRALERAGSVARAKVAAAHRPRAKDVPSPQVVSHLGPALLAASGIDDEALLDGALEQLRGDFDQWIADAQRDALDAAIAMAPDDPDPEAIAAFVQQQGRDRDDAWEWFSAAALALLARRMADGQALADWEVRALVRQSVAKAGGATELASTGADSSTEIPEGGAGGLATGPAMLGLLVAMGVAVTSWEWVHGEPDRPYPDHVELNGRVEANPDDFDGQAPGDHEGCTCNLEPHLVEVPT